MWWFICLQVIKTNLKKHATHWQRYLKIPRNAQAALIHVIFFIGGWFQTLPLLLCARRLQFYLLSDPHGLFATFLKTSIECRLALTNVHSCALRLCLGLTFTKFKLLSLMLTLCDENQIRPGGHYWIREKKRTLLGVGVWSFANCVILFPELQV